MLAGEAPGNTGGLTGSSYAVTAVFLNQSLPHNPLLPAQNLRDFAIRFLDGRSRVNSASHSGHILHVQPATHGI